VYYTFPSFSALWNTPLEQILAPGESIEYPRLSPRDKFYGRMHPKGVLLAVKDPRYNINWHR